MMDRINNRREFWFGYLGYGLISLSSKCCCCLKQRLVRKWPYYRKQYMDYKKFQKARQDLTREKDVEHMIYNLRIQKFMQKTLLKKRQRDVVQYFLRYLIEREDLKGEKSVARRFKTANQLTEDFEPTADLYDRRILFELAKRRIDEDEYKEDTSFEEDPFESERGNDYLSRLLGDVNLEGDHDHHDEIRMSIPVQRRPVFDDESALIRQDEDDDKGLNADTIN